MTSGPTGSPTTIVEGGRAKAFRPIPAAKRHAAVRDALAAWGRDDWFEAHELLEPAWMGADDPDERDLYGGLIKLAAAYVHRARGNAVGMAKNLVGAEARLRRVALHHDKLLGIWVRDLVEEVARRTPPGGGPADLGTVPPSIPTEEVR